MRYTQHDVDADGWTEWISPQASGYKQRCCDCGLVHEIDFREVNGKVQYRARRHSKATAGSRRRAA